MITSIFCVYFYANSIKYMGTVLTVCNVFLYFNWIDGCCYHDSLFPDGEVPASCRQNNVFEEGRSLYRIHQPVMDAKTLEGLGTWERGEIDRKRRHTVLFDSNLLPQRQQGNASRNEPSVLCVPVNLLSNLWWWLHSAWLPNQRVDLHWYSKTVIWT